MLCQIVDIDQGEIWRHDIDISVGHSPGGPDTSLIVLEPRKGDIGGEIFVAGFIARFVYANDIDLFTQLFLKFIEALKLSTTVASRGVSEIPCGDPLLKF